MDESLTTAMVADINTTAGASSSPGSLTNVNGTLFFTASDGTGVGHHGTELYKFTPGDLAPTLFDINPATTATASSISNLFNANGTLYFTATDGTHGVELYKIAPADSAPTLYDINVGSATSSPASFTNMNGTLFFTANDGTHGAELYKFTPGDSAPTLFDINTSAVGAGSSPANLTYFNGNVYFSAFDGAQTSGWHGTELWKVDTTTWAASMVADIRTDSFGSSNPTNLTLSGGSLYFVATDSTHGPEVWVTNGIPDGQPGADTHLVKDVAPGNVVYQTTNVANLTDVNGTLYFTENDGLPGSGGHGNELWQTNGTAAGTGLVADINTSAVVGGNGNL